MTPFLINTGSSEVQAKMLQLGENLGGKVDLPTLPFTDGGFVQLNSHNKLNVLQIFESGVWFVHPSEEEVATGLKKFIQVKQSK